MWPTGGPFEAEPQEEGGGKPWCDPEGGPGDSLVWQPSGCRCPGQVQTCTAWVSLALSDLSPTLDPTRVEYWCEVWDHVRGPRKAARTLTDGGAPRRTLEDMPRQRKPEFAQGTPLWENPDLSTFSPSPACGRIQGGPSESTRTPGGSRARPLCSQAGFLFLVIVGARG